MANIPTLTRVASAVWVNAVATAKSFIRTWGLEIETGVNAALGRSQLINGYFTATVSANVLTVAIKTLAGADPSVADPVYIDFPSQTASDGITNRRAITAATSLVISAGSTLGFANSVPGRVWVVAFDDAATVRLAAFNAFAGNAANGGGSISGLLSGMVASAVSEGGIGAADSAGVFYAGATVTSKPFVVIGFAGWETVMATAGNWSANPGVVHQQRIGDRLPGDVVQIAEFVDGAMVTGATTTPLDNTIPTSAEGVLFMTQAITPRAKANVLEVVHEGMYAVSAAVHIIAALLQDATAAALHARAQKCTASGDVQIVVLSYRMIANTVASTSFKIRTGPSAAGTITFNGSAGVVLFGGVANSRLTITERMA